MGFAQELLVLGVYMAALVLCTAVGGWAFKKLAKRDLTLRYGVTISVAQCIAIAGFGSALTMLFSRWVGEAYTIAIMLCLVTASYGIGLGFEIGRRKGGHKSDGSSGDAALDSQGS